MKGGVEVDPERWARYMAERQDRSPLMDLHPGSLIRLKRVAPSWVAIDEWLAECALG